MESEQVGVEVLTTCGAVPASSGRTSDPHERVVNMASLRMFVDMLPKQQRIEAGGLHEQRACGFPTRATCAVS